VVWNRILQFLQANDVTARRGDFERGTIEADRLNYQDAGWAACELAIRTDRSRDPPARGARGSGWIATSS
jgi:hypothetical protein